ncbi:MAG: PIG-L family deacetylase [Candidatus Sumerlaeota bacterium]|nr:PIG-L family deacetylase [Candidatus Sumerlaeota bacterium]
MRETFKFYRRSDNGAAQAGEIGKIFSGWKGAKERWMFLSPHDDDSVIGAGLTILAGIANGIETHSVITTDGCMGYCDLSQQYSISEERLKEAVASYVSLGLPPANVHFLHFPDCSLGHYSGRRRTEHTDITDIHDYTGLQNAFTYILRKIAPTRVFLPTGADFHPDHKMVHQELLISIFHAQGEIWPELGKPIPQIPQVYEFAVYCDLPKPPQIKIEAKEKTLQKKLDAIATFVSQRQISAIVSQIRQAGAVEYLHEVQFQLYSPEKYAGLFP